MRKPNNRGRKSWSPTDPPEEDEDEYEPLPPLPPYSANVKLKENPGD